uniref:GOLD domain-containing protein n=1 Tax=Syphacia muris TaxID=451379 RepID=A0A0N5B0T1_9BILA
MLKKGLRFQKNEQGNERNNREIRAKKKAMSTIRRDNNETTSEHNTLLFYLTPKSGMDCFYQHIQTGSKLKVAFMTLDTQQQYLHMRISSESDAFSEWFEGVDRVTYDGNTTETGVYEICVTAKIGFGRLKVLIDTYVYNMVAIEKAFNKYIEGENLENSVEVMLLIWIVRVRFQELLSTFNST